MKKILYAVVGAFLFLSCGQEKKVEITVENPSDFDRLTDMVEVPLNEVESRISLNDNQAYIVKGKNGNVVTSQITSDGKLIFQAGVGAGETTSYVIEAGEAQEYAPQTYGRFITERKDDFAWENDRVAFRVYGPALIAIDGPSNGIDFWYKRTPDMIIDKWYKNDLGGTASYHEDHGEGLDDYKVGRSLGGGAMAPFVGNKLWLNENFTSQEVMDNGPLRTTFKLAYKNIDVDGKSIGESRTFTIDAGSQLTKVTQEYGTSEEMPVAAGLAKRESGDSIIVASDNTYILYMEPQTNKVEGIYPALVFPQGFSQMLVDTYNVNNEKTKKEDTYSHVLAVTSYKPNTPVTYYTGYGWNKYGFSDEKDFEKYLQNFVKSANEPLKITIK
ncbi:MAG TPA: DUF4861 domain-containing protein [Dysgonomonas sp.]|nr:DUF4861 domain-containing protein [Dysgonomonas sp.]